MLATTHVLHISIPLQSHQRTEREKKREEKKETQKQTRVSQVRYVSIRHMEVLYKNTNQEYDDDDDDYNRKVLNELYWL